MIKKTTHINDPLKLLESLPTIQVPVPEYLYLATVNARCSKAEIFIKEGDYVKCGQQVGVRFGPFFEQPIHASCSGVFEGYEKHYHRSGKQIDFLKIHNDFKDVWDESVHLRTDEEIARMTKEEMTEIIKKTASVGLGGSSFPSYIKMQTDRPINTILINGIECEPYINADKRTMMEEAPKLLEGILFLMQAFKCHDARICVKDIHKEIFVYYNYLLTQEKYKGITMAKMKNYYPQGWEIAMIKQATGIDVPSGHLPSEFGIMNFNSSSVVGIQQAIRENKPVTDRKVTVTGNGIVRPTNFEVRIGTPVRYLIEQCGGYKNPNTPKVFILGGPMMGASESDEDCICSKTVTSIIVLDHVEYEEEACIRCGSCVLSCPVGLQPVTIMNTMKHAPVDKAKIKMLNPLKCIECGLCTYSCTSKIHVTDYIRRAKTIARLK